jgi:hypothetical protein
MLKPVKRDNKKPYSSPLITVYGTVQQLTQNVGIKGNKDNGTNLKIRTHIF